MKSFFADKSLFVICIVGILFVSVFFYIAQSYALVFDDYNFSCYLHNERLFAPLVPYKHGGGYIGYLLSKMLSFYIPVKLGIHPCDFYFHSVLRACFACIIFFLISKFICIYFKSAKLQSLAYTFISLYFLYLAFKYSPLIIGVNYNYYRYVFSLIFFCPFIGFLYKNLISNRKISVKQLFLYSLCALECGFASEIEFVSLSVLFVLIFLYNIIFKHNKTFKFNLNKSFYIPFFTFCFAVLCFTGSNGFQKVAKSRGIGSVVMTKDLITDFLSQFYDLYISDFKIYWILCLIIFISAFISAYKRKEIKKIIFPFFLTVSIIISILSLVFCGRTYYNHTDFWLVHTQIRTLYGILLLIPLFIAFSYAIRTILPKMKSHNKRKTFVKSVIILSIFLCILPLAGIFKMKNDIIEENNKALMFKQILYKTEKMYRFFRLKNEIPYLPNNLRQRNIFDMYENQDYCIYEKNKFFLGYYPLIYNDKNIEEFQMYCVKSGSSEIYNTMGGTFNEEEMKHIKFSRLYDENFVLNKK